MLNLVSDSDMLLVRRRSPVPAPRCVPPSMDVTHLERPPVIPVLPRLRVEVVSALTSGDSEGDFIIPVVGTDDGFNSARPGGIDVRIGWWPVVAHWRIVRLNSRHNGHRLLCSQRMK